MQRKITAFQRAVLQNREAVLKEFADYAAAKKMTFTEVPFNESLEYAVLEFPFSFWQWGGKCDAIPPVTALPKELFNYLNDVVGVRTYNDINYFNYLPSYYQHLSELGYYGFDFTPVADLLQVVKVPQMIDLHQKALRSNTILHILRKFENMSKTKEIKFCMSTEVMIPGFLALQHQARNWMP